MFGLLGFQKHRFGFERQARLFGGDRGNFRVYAALGRVHIGKFESNIIGRLIFRIFDEIGQRERNLGLADRRSFRRAVNCDQNIELIDPARFFGAHFDRERFILRNCPADIRNALAVRISVHGIGIDDVASSESRNIYHTAVIAARIGGEILR